MPVFQHCGYPDADGSDVRLLARGGYLAVDPAWSPDGRTIAFESDRPGGDTSIVLINPDGTDRRVLASGRDPSWSPDGTGIVFTCSRGGICTVNADGSGKSRILDDPDAFDPAWSPDGSHIVVGLYSPTGSADLWVMEADGTNLRKLTGKPGFEGKPDWQPLPPAQSTNPGPDASIAVVGAAPDAPPHVVKPLLQVVPHSEDISAEGMLGQHGRAGGRGHRHRP
jgi:Tol biopolymer transport system component